MATIYYDMDNFGYSTKLHKQLVRELAHYDIIGQKFIGDARQLKTIPGGVPTNHQLILCEKKEGFKDSTDFRITIEIMDDLKKKGHNYFIVASHDKDYIEIAKKIHASGKKFGILSRQAISPILKDHCDIVLLLKDGRILCEEKDKGKNKGLYTKEPTTKEVETQTEEQAVSIVETYKSNLVLAWIDYNCKGYKRIAVDLDNMMKQMEQNAVDVSPPLRFQALHRDMSNQLFWPPALSCDCARIANPIGGKVPEQCPVFHLYRAGRVQCQVIGSNLKELRRAIKLEYNVVI